MTGEPPTVPTYDDRAAIAPEMSHAGPTDNTGLGDATLNDLAENAADPNAPEARPDYRHPMERPQRSADSPGPRGGSEEVTRPLRRAQAQARKRRQWWVGTLASVVGIAVLATCAVGAWMILQETEPQFVPDASQQPDAGDSVDFEPEPDDPIISRDTNPEPVSAAELFPQEQFQPEGGVSSYTVLLTEEVNDCAEAAFEGVADLLAEADCSQVVRGTVLDASERYVATVGVVNLSDADEATALGEALNGGDVDGGFTALREDEGPSAELGRTPTVLGHNTYGHFLLYSVVGQTDGDTPDSGGGDVRALIDDLVDGWAVDQLEPRRGR
ncbi:hypothetical protein [Natronoglycomyces albus]|uniref:Uncharacterized protein n=1 Tax=Natronoglycomyces albus TaxID=2811108 RepID=A0A895XRH2_9ACTN|nr:hypothetical protein [Natronoglycomyces albus]QSB06123.1 hypothetical protein JQS30_04180 [Natronoglycomyces albus]